MSFSRKLKTVHPLAGSLVFAGALLIGRLLLNWVVSKNQPNLHFWSTVSMLLGPVLGTAIAGGVVYLLLAKLRREHQLMEMLNHELRNALQILAYLVPASHAQQREAARDALERITKVMRKISKQMGD